MPVIQLPACVLRYISQNCFVFRDIRVLQILHTDTAVRTDHEDSGSKSFCIIVSLEICDPAGGDLRKPVIRMAAADKIHNRRIHCFGGFHRVVMYDDDQDVRLLFCTNFPGQGIQGSEIRINRVRRNARRHDTAAVIRKPADDSNAQAGLFNDRIIPGEVHAFPGNSIIQVGSKNRDRRVAETVTEDIRCHGAVRIRGVFRDFPVEFVIAEADSVITHRIEGRAHDGTAGHIGNRCSLVYIPAVEEKNAVIQAGRAGIIHHLRNTGKTVAKRVFAAGSNIHDVAVDIRRFDDEDALFCCLRCSRSGGRGGNDEQEGKKQDSKLPDHLMILLSDQRKVFHCI